MKLITSNEVSCDNVEALGQCFSSYGLGVEVKQPEGFGNARVDLTFPSIDEVNDSEVLVIVWVPSREPEMLKFRVVLFDRNERDKLKKDDDLWKEINRVAEMLNENAFGHLSLSSMVGICLDYSLTMEGGVADSTLIGSAKELARIARGAKSSISDEISYAE